MLPNREQEQEQRVPNTKFFLFSFWERIKWAANPNGTLPFFYFFFFSHTRMARKTACSHADWGMRA
jgi:hypothetical protein